MIVLTAWNGIGNAILCAEENRIVRCYFAHDCGALPQTLNTVTVLVYNSRDHQRNVF